MTASAIRSSAALAPGIDEIRAQFPALERVHGGHRVAYFDGPGGTQVPVSVADAIRDYLLKKGIAASRLTAIGYGQTRPVADNTTPAGKAANRRVELRLSMEKR